MVPNSTAGMIIGKGGSFIKELKDTTGVFIQVSQKSKELNLAERCVTVAGKFINSCYMVDSKLKLFITIHDLFELYFCLILFAVDFLSSAIYMSVISCTRISHAYM